MKNSIYLTIALLAFGCALLSCKSYEKVNQEEVTNSTLNQENTLINKDKDSNERVFFASITRTACYGTCPIYKMVIYFDGHVELEGIQFVDQIGNFTSKISSAQIRNFEIRANRTGFMDMEDRYDAPITDVPSATTTLVLNGVRKSVYRRANFPPAILQLEVLFDDLLKSQKWAPVKPSK